MTSTDNVHDLFQPDAEVIRHHLELLFQRVRDAYPDGLCEIAWADGIGQVNSANTFPVTAQGLDEATACAVRHNKERRNVYVGINPRKPGTAPFGRGKAEDVEIAFFNFAEIDSAEGAQKLRRAPLPYTWAVTTGRVPNPRPHPYWELEEPVRNMQAWAAQQRALAAYFDGDPMYDPPRIMRLAGTVNHPSQKKIARGYRVEKVTLRSLYDGEKRDPVSSEALFHAYPWSDGERKNDYDPATGEAHEDEPPKGGGRDGGGPNFTSRQGRIDPRECIRNINAGINLHINARDLIAHLVGTGHRDWIIEELLTRLLTPVSDGGTLRLIPELIRTARVKYQTPDPEEDWESYAPRHLPLEWLADIEVSLNAADFVEGLLCESGMSVVYGETNCGKTFFMTDLAFHIAAGRRWRGREVEQGGVIYVALEGGFGIRNRLAALRLHYGTGSTRIPLGIVPCSINMLDPNADTGPLIELIKEAAANLGMSVKLVIIDTLSRAMNGGNENGSEDMGKLVKSADRIREQTGAHVAFVHHSGKDQAKGARGHSLLRAATDTEIEIVREVEVDLGIATVTKQRELEIDGQFGFKLKQVALGVNRRGKEVTSCVIESAETPEGTTERRVKLTEFEYGYWREIKEIHSRDGLTELRSPEPGMPVMRVLSRETLRNWLIRRGKLAVTGDRDGLSNADRQRLFRIVSALSDKGFIGMNQEFIWVLK